MSLDISPQAESILEQAAEREGVSVDTLVYRTFGTARSTNRTVPADDPVLQFLNARLQEAENATPEEQAEAEAEWQAFAHNMNENRRTTGERLLYPETIKP